MNQRRRLLSTAASLLGIAVAGCTDGGDGGSETPAEDDEGTEETATESADGSGAESTTTEGVGELDLREANVVGVETERNDGDVRFSVTLIHDDDGEDGYANWWQVETLDGEELGRRDLAHPHGTQEFTRSESIEIPASVECVVVRGHDQTHGYGGQAMLHDLDSGATRAVRQGSEPAEFGAEDCP